MTSIEQAILVTCQDMIDRDGVNSISVRKLVGASGCSLRSLYNKFQSLGRVFAAVIDIFTLDVARHVTDGASQSIETDEALFAVHELFVAYFLQHPNRFYFLYLYRHEGLPNESTVFATPGFQERIQDSFAYLIRDGRIDAEGLVQLRSNILYGLFGLLTFYFTGNFGLSSEEVRSEFRRFFFTQLSALGRQNP